MFDLALAAITNNSEVQILEYIKPGPMTQSNKAIVNSALKSKPDLFKQDLKDCINGGGNKMIIEMDQENIEVNCFTKDNKLKNPSTNLSELTGRTVLKFQSLGVTGKMIINYVNGKLKLTII